MLKLKPARLLSVCAAALLLLGATGCHYDYGYTSVSYSYGYDCAPRYYNNWNCNYSYPRYYHAPSDGLRVYTGYTFGTGSGHHRPCR